MEKWFWWAVFWLVVTVVYGLSCWRWPLAKCLKCEGEGKFRRDDRKVWRKCRRCKGTGERIRVGRKLFNWWYMRHRETR